MIKILIAEDSITQREILARVVRGHPGMVVTGEAKNGVEAVEKVRELSPDVVLMDVHMDQMNGIEATRRIMQENPVPIVIMSSTLQKRDIDLAVEALRVGAVAAIEKPKGAALLHLAKIAPKLHKILQEAAATKVRSTKTEPPIKAAVKSDSPYQLPTSAVNVIGICSSAGGPSVLVQIFSALPASYPVPILLVQHISSGFEEGFAKWLTHQTGQTAQIAEDGQRLTPGVWLAPKDKHIVLKTPTRIGWLPRREEDIHCPAGNPLLASLADQQGRKAVGLVLTGMGDDGANGLLAMKQAGAQTIIQNEASAMVWGMPQAAKKLGAFDYELTPPEIAEALCRVGAR